MSKLAKRISTLRKDFVKGIGVPKKSPFVPDEYQLNAIAALGKEKDTLVIAPTGAGKTYVAVEAIRETIKSGKRAVYTAPLKALSNSKHVEFKKCFEPEFSVGLLTGDRKIEGDADVVVATTEIYRNELYSYGENYALVVLDEFHYLADPQRGPVWEESVILSPSSATLLMLSASISNAEEIAAWIELVRKKSVEIISVTERPVELRLGFLHPEHGVIPLGDKDGKVLQEVESFYSRGNQARVPGFKRGGKSRNSSKGRSNSKKRGRKKK